MYYAPILIPDSDSQTTCVLFDAPLNVGAVVGKLTEAAGTIALAALGPADVQVLEQLKTLSAGYERAEKAAASMLTARRSDELAATAVSLCVRLLGLPQAYLLPGTVVRHSGFAFSLFCCC